MKPPIVDRLIDAVAGNCDTANMNRDGAREDVLQVLRDEVNMTHHFSNEATGEGVILSIVKTDAVAGGLLLEGGGVPPEFQKLFGGFGTVVGVLLWPQEDGVIRVSYQDGFEIKFVPVIEPTPGEATH